MTNLTTSEVVNMAAGGNNESSSDNISPEAQQQVVGDWLRGQFEESLKIRQDSVESEAIEVLGGTADMLLVGPFQFFGGPVFAPFPPADVIRAGEFAFVAVVQVYSPFDIAASAPFFALPFEIELRTGSLHNWNLAEAALQGQLNGNLAQNQFIYVNFFGFVPAAADLCEMNAWIQLLDAQGNPSGAGGFARSVLPTTAPAIFPVDPPPSDTGLRFAVTTGP